LLGKSDGYSISVTVDALPDQPGSESDLLGIGMDILKKNWKLAKEQPFQYCEADFCPSSKKDGA
jgi:hypothetical protein